MKTLYLFIFVVILTCVFSFQINAQPSGFEQVFTFSSSSHFSTVLEVNDGYVCGGYSPTNLCLLKTDGDGNYLWEKTYPRDTIWTENELSNSIITLPYGGFLAVTTIKEGGIPKIGLLKLDSTGNVEWQKTYGDSSNQFGNTLTKNSEGGYYIVGGMNPYFEYNSSFRQAVLIKIDEQGNELWKSYFPDESAADRGYLVSEFNDTTTILGCKFGIYLINQDGDVSMQIQNIGILRSMDVYRDSLIIVGTGSILSAYNRFGDLIWTKLNFIGSINVIHRTNEGQFILCTSSEDRNYLVKLDSSKEVLWQRQLHGINNALLETSGQRLVTAGSFYSVFFNKKFFWILKTDSSGNYNDLSLISPFNDLHPGDIYNIKWLNTESSEVNIDFSTDNGTSWINLTNNYPADAETFTWLIPYNFSDSCLLKITDSSNPLLYDTNDLLFSITASEDYDFIAINEIKMWVGNSGDGSHSPSSGPHGFLWPGGIDATQGAIAEDGLVWAGMVNGQLKAGGSFGKHGLQPGNILEDGSAADPNDPRFKVWKSRINWEQLPPGPEKDAYAFDYNNWPADLGAPWVDVDGDGEYTSGIDHPKYIGDEILFFVANDLDTSLTTALYGSNPIGLEMQCEVFGFDATNTLKDVVFKKYKLINRSGSAVNDMYFGYYSDDDLGDGDDDFTGVDTLLNLGFTWNGVPDDPVYGTPPPAVGHLVVQPPVAPSTAADSARYGEGWMKGYKNLPVTAFMLYLNGSSVYADPDYADEIYNNMKGYSWDGQPIIDPWTIEAIKFTVPGDPVLGTGWYEGNGWPGGPAPSDQRYLITSGPFNLAAGDTQEIAIAIFMAEGSDNIQSITKLRNDADFVQNFYDGALVTNIKDKVKSPSVYSLRQNYPNPFNPVTVIQYSLEKQSEVKLKIYDVLGREVSTLVNKVQRPGSYSINFNAASLASGVYFYRIEAGSYVQTKKMILLK